MVLAGHVGHKAAHAAELTQLGLENHERRSRPSCKIGLLFVEEAEHLGLADVVGSISPVVDDLGVTLLLG